MSDTKVVVVTGASDGIGAAAARKLHANGHTVVVVGRSAEKTRTVAADIGAACFVADFTRLDDVERLAAELRAAYPRIDVLANNAGGVFGTRTKTVDGFEKTFQVNHLAPYLLTRLLLDVLIASRASVLQTSSTVRFAKEIHLDDLDHDRAYNAVHAYGASKLENILFTTELHRRHHADGLAAASFYPGNVRTNFATDTTSAIMRTVRFIGTKPLVRNVMLATPEQGADQIVWLAEGVPGADWRSGAYYYKRRDVPPKNPQALDADLARRLWERSEDLLADRLRASA